MNRIVLPSGNVVPALSEQEEFARRLREQWEAKKTRNGWTYVRRPKRIRGWNISTSGESSFRQNGYEKKVVSEKQQSKRDWRNRKGFNRDRQKGNCWCKCKLNDAREGRRAWERNILRDTISQNEDAWEELLEYNKDMFTSGWDCC